jgi:hypothetical protein
MSLGLRVESSVREIWDNALDEYYPYIAEDISLCKLGINMRKGDEDAGFF